MSITTDREISPELFRQAMLIAYRIGDLVPAMESMGLDYRGYVAMAAESLAGMGHGRADDSRRIAIAYSALLTASMAIDR